MAPSQTVSAMKGFVLAMVLHPEVQIRAQQEIDRVCQGRLPDFDDYDDLPYVHAMVKEVLRWCPTFALSKLETPTSLLKCAAHSPRSGHRYPAQGDV